VEILRLEAGDEQLVLLVEFPRAGREVPACEIAVENLLLAAAA
jgi:hypothetical protein